MVKSVLANCASHVGIGRMRRGEIAFTELRIRSREPYLGGRGVVRGGGFVVSLQGSV